jgi:glycosyltransferase involved in cell wall biosynthesis
VNVVHLNYAFDKTLTNPEALLARYRTLTGWSDAIAGAGADRVVVVQRFHRDARLVCSDVEYTFCSRSRVHRAVAGARPDVVHVNGLHFAAHTWLLRQHLDRSAAIVVQDHGGGAPAGGLHVNRAIRRTLIGAADGFLFAAAEQAEAWQRAGLLPSTSRVYEVMEASTTFGAMPRSDARAWSGVDGDPAVLWVGRLNANKDPLTVVEGFEQSLRDLPAARLTMVYQDDELLPAVRERVDRSSALRRRVRFVGPIAHERLPAFYSASDLFVLGSHHEGSGYALLEACACGALPVVTDIPSFRVITDGGAFGSLWSAGDAAACARALVKTARSDMAHARALMSSHFDRALSWRAIGRQAIAAYHDALASRRARLGIDLLEAASRPLR